MACDVAPGDVQIDTFALGGGDLSDNFNWILMGSDRKMQWFGLAPTWNRGSKTTMVALRTIAGGFPFAITSLHGDNGDGFINRHLLRELPGLLPDCVLSRSRPRRCNDNAHVERKNGAIGRRVFGETRVDCPEPARSSRGFAPRSPCTSTCTVHARCSWRRRNVRTGRASPAGTTNRRPRWRGCWRRASCRIRKRRDSSR